ncbi:MAG: DNA primase [Bacteroidia bacterium]
MITQKTIERVLEVAAIEEVIGEFVQLKKSGSNYKGLSPFVDEKTPSFMVSPAKGIFKDFSSGKGGNVLSFLMEHEQMSYPEAIRWLAEKYNIEIEEEYTETSQEQQEVNTLRESLYIVNQFAEKTFHDNLFNTEEGKNIGLSYFHERQFSDDTIKKFNLGYCLDEWDGFTKKALENGYKLEFLEKTGLTKLNENKQFDFFKGRVMFPIHNITGKVVGFGGRILKTDKKSAKYFNSPESEVYNKSRILYGLFQAKKAISTLDNCFLVEGYTDVISLHQAGIENVVASSGTALTKEQISLIKRYTPNITVLYDGDAAGIKASFRGIDLILEQGLNVKALLFPDGEDPDSFAKRVSNSELKDYLGKHSKDFISFKTELLLEETKGDPIKKATLIRDIVQSIALIPDAIARQVYIKTCSEQFDIQEQALLNELTKILREKTKKRINNNEENYLPSTDVLPTKQQDIFKSTLEHQELDIIRILFNYGDQKISIDAEDEEGKEIKTEVSIAEYILHDLEHDNLKLENKLYQDILEVYIAHLDINSVPTLNDFYTSVNNEIKQLAIDLTTSLHHLSENWHKKHNIFPGTEDSKLLRAVHEAMAMYKLKRLAISISKLQDELKTKQGSEEQIRLMKEMMQLQKAEISLSQELGIIVKK